MSLSTGARAIPVSRGSTGRVACDVGEPGNRRLRQAFGRSPERLTFPVCRLQTPLGGKTEEFGVLMRAHHPKCYALFKAL
jgi:hypothetical protein